MARSDFHQLYQELLLDHSKERHGYGLEADPVAESHGLNRSCGDYVTLRIHSGSGVALHPPRINCAMLAWAALEDGLLWLPRGVDEILRINMPLLANRRLATAEVTLSGRGIHDCPGAPLARQDLTIITEELLAETTTIRPVEDSAPDFAVFPAGGFATLHLEFG